MAKIILLDEMLGVIVENQWPGHRALKQMAEGLADMMGKIIADKTGCVCGPASFEGDCGTAASFYPLVNGDAVPRELADLDIDGDWEPLGQA